MQNRSYLLGTIGILAIAACSPSTPDGATSEAAQPSMADMPEMAQAPAPVEARAEPIAGVGVVTAVDREAGTVGLRHEPIPALNWSSMTMTFTAEPQLLADIAIGDSVSFTIKSPTESQALTQIQKE